MLVIPVAKRFLNSSSKKTIKNGNNLLAKQAAQKSTKQMMFKSSSKTATTTTFSNFKFFSQTNSKFNSLCKQFYATQVDSNLANATVLQVQHDDTVHKITIPLPNGERCSFPLKHNETVRHLIEDIRQEDSSINTLVIKYASDGLRVSHSTTVDDLLRSEFIIQINDKSYKVPVSQQQHGLDDIPEGAVTVSDLKALMQRAYFQKLRERLNEDPRHHMEYSEYINWAREFGVSEQDASKLLRALHFSGIVLHFAENSELNKYIFLHPQTVFNKITDALNLKYIKASDMVKLSELQTLQKQFSALDAKKEDLDARANTYATWMMRLGFVGLSIQFAFLARLVWIDFNWDIMEPITYFVSLGTLIISYGFFVLTKQDYTYPALKIRVANKRKRKLYLANGFNWKKWNTINERIQQIKQDLHLSPPSQENKQDS